MLALKQSRKKHMDTAIVNTCLWVKLDADWNIIKCRLVYGGISHTTVIATATEAKLRGR